jgi:hypothetical protein
MRWRWGWTTVVGMIAAGATTVGCGDDGGTATGAVGSTELPFGLEPVHGTEPIGRPAVFDDTPYTYNGRPVRSQALRAAYRVTAADPLEAVRSWAEQLDGGLTLRAVHIDANQADEAPGPWVEVSADAEDDWVDLELWATDDGPIILVSLDRISDEPPLASTVVDEAGSPPAPEPTDLAPAGRTAGDELFTEQGNTIHLPEGTTALTPTIPTMAGTGGSTSVLAAEDGEAAVQAMLAEALELDADGRVDGPEVSESDGAEVMAAGYVRDAGGWGFDIVSVQGPDDPTATLYITSAAD